MANYKPDLSCQNKFIPVDFLLQIIPGTFEYALAHIIDYKRKRNWLVVRLRINECVSVPGTTSVKPWALSL